MSDDELDRLDDETGDMLTIGAVYLWTVLGCLPAVAIVAAMVWCLWR